MRNEKRRGIQGECLCYSLLCSVIRTCALPVQGECCLLMSPKPRSRVCVLKNKEKQLLDYIYELFKPITFKI